MLVELAGGFTLAAQEAHAEMVRAYAADTAASDGRATRRGCCGGIRPTVVWSRNVGQTSSPGRAQSPAQRK